MPQRERDPLAPIETTVTAMLAVVVASVAIFLVLAAIAGVQGKDSDVSFATIGDNNACATVSNGAVPGTTDIPQRGIRKDDASVYVEQVEVCLEDPTPPQKVASALTPVGNTMLGVGALLLLRRLVRTGRRTGLFTTCLSRQMQQLGWFLLAMSLVWPFLAAAGRGIVLQAAVPDRSWTFVLFDPDLSVGLILTAVGVLTVARVLRRAVLLQEDVDETV